jgi:hypothetical protein
MRAKAEQTRKEKGEVPSAHQASNSKVHYQSRRYEGKNARHYHCSRHSVSEELHGEQNQPCHQRNGGSKNNPAPEILTNSHRMAQRLRSDACVSHVACSALLDVMGSNGRTLELCRAG